MSKFLKFIIHLVILLTILDVLALAVPPFMGITTAIIDGSESATNLPVGSVTYAKATDVNSLKTGDSILEQDGDSTYRYKINGIDSSSGVYNVYDQTDVDAGEKSISLKNTAPKVVITIGYIGYLIIATQTMEGLIIIGLAVLFLIILFILSELWRKDKSNQSVGELDSEGEAQIAAGAEDVETSEPPKTKRQMKKELKQQMKQRAKEEVKQDKQKAKEEAKLDKERAKQEYEEATRQLKEEAKARKKQEKQKKKEAKKRARTGGFIEDLDPVEAQLSEKKQSISHADVAADEANKVLKQEVAAATTAPKVEEVLPEIKDADVPTEVLQMPETEEEKQKVEEKTVETEPIEIRKMAIPTYTEEELLAQAQAAGQTPSVIRDEKTGISLLDYSHIIIEETSQEKE